MAATTRVRPARSVTFITRLAFPTETGKGFVKCLNDPSPVTSTLSLFTDNLLPASTFPTSSRLRPNGTMRSNRMKGPGSPALALLKAATAALSSAAGGAGRRMLPPGAGRRRSILSRRHADFHAAISGASNSQNGILLNGNGIAVGISDAGSAGFICLDQVSFHQARADRYLVPFGPAGFACQLPCPLPKPVPLRDPWPLLPRASHPGRYLNDRESDRQGPRQTAHICPQQ